MVTDAVRRRNQAKSILSIAMGWFQVKAEHPIPLAVVRRNGGPVTVIATDNLEPGQLHVPFFFRKYLSVYSDMDRPWYDPNAIRVTVRWTEDPSDPNAKTYDDSTHVEVELKVIPEKHLPRDLTKPEHFDEKADIHPFWYIRRSIQADLVNAELVYTTVKVVSCSNFAALVEAGVKLLPAAEAYSVDLPCIVNAVPIKADDEVVVASPPRTWTTPHIKREHQVDMDNGRAVKCARRQ